MDDSGRGAEERWVDVEGVAAHLGVTTASVYRWIESRGLPVHRVGRLFRFRLSEVDAWVTGRRVDRVAEPVSAYRAESREMAEPAPPNAPIAVHGRWPWAIPPEQVPAAIDEMVRVIIDRFDPDCVVLFGSYARGDADPDSDVDLLVILPVRGSKRDLEIEIAVALDEIPLPKDVIVATPAEVLRYRDVAGTLLRPALREGRVLYGRLP